MQRICARQCDPSRHAFTLVELLVTMSIIIILASISVSGFRSAYDTDRVREAASILRGAIEGARSRAIRANEARGIRLLLDPDDPRMVTSVVHVGSPETLQGHLRLEFDNSTATEGYSRGKWRVMDVSEHVNFNNRINWRELYQSGLLRPGCTIEITISGKTETFNLLAASRFGSADSNDIAWILSAAPDEPSLIKDSSDPQIPRNADPSEPGLNIGLPDAIASRPLAYTLKLVPAVIEGVAPVSFPRNTCIDLDGSKLPDSWCPGASGRTVNGYGPYASNGTAQQLLPMDILFTSRGVVSNQYVTQGFFHFHMADKRDITTARDNTILPVTSLTNRPIVVQNPQYPCKIVTLVTNTGMPRISNVRGAGATGDPPQYNTQVMTGTTPFLNGILGQEAK